MGSAMEVDGFRSGFRRTGARGGVGVGGAGAGRGIEEAVDWSKRSRKGRQK